MKLSKVKIILLLTGLSLSLILMGTPRCLAQNGKTYPVRTIRVLDNRFKTIPDAQMEKISSTIEKTMKQHFGIRVDIIDRGMVEIGDFFDVYYHRMIPPKTSVYEDLYWSLQDPVEKLKRAQLNFYGKKKRLRKRGMTLEGLKRYLPQERQKRVAALGDFINELVDEGITRYREICNITLEDGIYLVNQNRLDFHNLWWWTIMEGMEEYDLILTNEILVDIELNMPPVALVRGGISTGFASNSISRYNGVAVMSTFPLIFQHPLFIRWRGKEIPEGEMEEVLGTYSCHELGHLLLHYLHPSNYPGSIMNPARGLNYYQWYEEVQKHDLKGETNPKGEIFNPENERWIRWYNKIRNNWKVLKDISYEELIEIKKKSRRIYQE